MSRRRASGPTLPGRRWRAIAIAAAVSVVVGACSADNQRSGEEQSDNHSALHTLLDERITAADRGDSDEVARIDGKIRDQFEQPVAVLVSDMSGFSARTESQGINASLALVRRLFHLADPLVNAHGAQLVKVDADNLFIIAEDPHALFDLANDLRSKVGQWDEQHPSETIGISIGLGYGPTVVVPQDIWGKSVNTAARLGEDIGKRGEVLVTDEFLGRLDADRAARCKPAGPDRESPVPFSLCT